MAALQHIKDADADTTTLKLLTNDGTGMQTALTIDSSGNVGIGSSSPSGTFHISSGTSGDCVLILEADTDNNNENDNPRIEFKQDGGVSHSAITNGNNELCLYNSSNSGSIRFYVGTDEGYENGIPRAYFGYDGDDENVGSLYLLNNRSTSVLSGSKLGEILFRGHSAQDSSDTSPVSIYGEADGDVTSTTHAGAIVLATASTGNRLERMRVTKDGNVGINDVSPISELSVAGKIAITSIQGSTPTAPTDANHGWLYTKSDGKIYWQSNGLSERDLTGSGDSGTFNTLTVGSGSDTGILQSNGDYNLQLKTGNTDTGSITIEDGIDGYINILANGTGEIDLTTTGLIDINGATINLTTTANSSSALYLNTLNGGALWLSSSSDIFVDAIGNIDLRQRTLINVSSKNYSPNADGLILHIDELTMTDNSTTASGTASEDFKFVKVDVPTLNSSNSSVTTTNASTFYIQGAPEDTGNMTITNPYALYVNSGNSYLGGYVGINDVSPISELSVAGKIAITSIQGSTPTAPTDANHGWLYTKSDGKIYWQSNGLTERDLTRGGGEMVTIPSTDSITESEHAGRINLLGEVGGNALVTLTLPDAQGTGNTYKFIISVVNTSSYVFKCPDANNTISGQILVKTDDSSTSVVSYATVSDTDTITLNGTTTGGSKIGDYVELIDIANDTWVVNGMVTASGVEVTPFSATV